jgi:Uncharacterized protein predicted to be involved in C-type cytochrome biogenesis
VEIVRLFAALLAARRYPHGLAQTYQGNSSLGRSSWRIQTPSFPARFTVGLLLRMAPGWHTYWKFSGDAGLPTEMKWKLAAGWKVGDIQWPIPLKTNDPGDIETYGYENEVLLMQEITPQGKSRFVSEPFRRSKLARMRKNLHPRQRNIAVRSACTSTSQPANTECSRVIGVWFRKICRDLMWRAPIGAGLDPIFA